jgi:hypothetical protein
MERLMRRSNPAGCSGEVFPDLIALIDSDDKILYHGIEKLESKADFQL